MNEMKNSDTAARFRNVGTRPVRPDGVSKVTGTARYGSDYHAPGMLVGKMLRSPHPHARILSIDTAKAEAVPGVQAIVTGADFPLLPFRYVGPDRIERNAWHDSRNVIAREKVFYHGHALAAVAAKDEATAMHAVTLNDVDYEVLPFTIEIEDAAAEDAPLLFEDMITHHVVPAPEKPSNISRRWTDTIGNIEAGFSEADEIVEGTYSNDPAHQGYIEPHACVAEYNKDGQAQLWVSSQGHFQMRDQTAAYAGIPNGDIRAIPAEIGGGFGGKTKVYLEPVAMMLSKKAGRPVKMVMTREEVFRAPGPAAGTRTWVKIGARKDGTITAVDLETWYQSGAFPGGPFVNGCLCAFSCYGIPNQRSVGYEVVSNRPKVAAYCAPGAPQTNFAVESALDVLAIPVYS